MTVCRSRGIEIGHLTYPALISEVRTIAGGEISPAILYTLSRSVVLDRSDVGRHLDRCLAIRRHQVGQLPPGLLKRRQGRRGRFARPTTSARSVSVPATIDFLALLADGCRHGNPRGPQS